MADEERYEIQGKIGQGGLGSIYRAFDRQLNRNVAIKRINPDPDADPEEAINSIIKESRALSALSSTNIVSIFDIDQDEDGPYVVMEYLEGETLEELVTRAPLVEADFISTAEQSLEGLLAAHSENVTHRDIKPSNIMYTWLPSGSFLLKILDFGLAKFASEPAVQTMAHGKELMGSIYYMAPEQFARKPLDARTDLYSLGCVLYYSITGNNPFEGENATEVMAGHIQGNYPPLDDIRPDLHPELLRFVDRLMALAPDDRFSSAQEALDALAQVKQVVKKTDRVTATAPGTERPVLATGPIATVGTGPQTVKDTESHPLTVTLPTTGLPVWLLILVGVLSAVILVLATVALMSERPSVPDSDVGAKKEIVEKQEEQKGEQPPAINAPLPESQINPPPNENNTKPANPPQKDGLVFQRFLKKWDKNEDGRLAIAELSHPGENIHIINQFNNRLNQLDSNKNGFLEPREVHLRSQRAAAISAIKKHDANNDGALSKEEFMSYVASSEIQINEGYFFQLDFNQNNKFDPEEFEIARITHWIWRIFPL